MTPLDRVRQALREAGSTGRGDSWQCPAHKDREPSLSLGAGADGRVLLHCHAGCELDQVLAALGLGAQDLFAEPAGNGARSIEATYDYTDEDGRLLFQAVRFVPKGFAQRRPDGQGGWIWKLGDTRRVLYRLPEVLAAIAAGRTIYVCEGEKDVHALEKAGQVATCNPMGAGSWRDEYAQSLRGARVVVIADADREGRVHAARVAGALRGVPGSVRMMEPATGKDAHDHLAAGLGIEDLVEDTTPDGPLALLQAEPIEAFAAVDEQSARPLVGDEETNILPAAGDLVIYGEGGSGKTTLEIDLAMHIATGREWLGIPIAAPSRVLLIENEGPRGMFRKKLRAKLEAWAGDQPDDAIQVVSMPWGEVDFSDQGLRTDLVRLIRELRIDILAAGPVSRLGMKGGGTPEEVLAFVALLADVRGELADELATILVHHENKAGAISGAWEGVPDTLIKVESRGNGKTHLFWQKARWAGSLHGRKWDLLWGDGESFEIDDTPEVTVDEVRESILEFVEANPGCAWTPVRKACPGNANRLAELRDQLIDEGALVNLGSGRGGRGGQGGGGYKFYLAGCDMPSQPSFQMENDGRNDAPPTVPGTTPERSSFQPGTPEGGKGGNDAHRPPSDRQPERRSDTRTTGGDGDDYEDRFKARGLRPMFGPDEEGS